MNGHQLAFTCPRCSRTSHHPTDLIEGYCGRCHDWTGSDPMPDVVGRFGEELDDLEPEQPMTHISAAVDADR